MKRYTKKPKPASRKTLERNLRKAEHTIAAQSVLLKEKTETVQKLRGGLQSAQSRVRELEERLDGIFRRGEFFRVDGYIQDFPRPLEIDMPAVRLCLDLGVREFRMPRSYDIQHLKAHIVDMLLRDAKGKLIEALRVL